MGNGCNNNNHHLHQQNIFYSKTTFFPLLCRVSIKDVKLRDFKDQTSNSVSGDPSSPKVSCMGQVKRGSKVIGIPTPHRLTSTATTAGAAAATTTAATSSAITTAKTHVNNHSHFKYIKLKRLFSGRNLMTTTAAAAAAGGASTAASSTRSRSCNSSRGEIMSRNYSRRSSKINNNDDSNFQCSLNISELDPPLPVIKKEQLPSEVNLWKRRSGGLALKSLQIEQIHQLPNNNYHPATTV